MPFIHSHKLLFIHIPKTGGSSVERKFNINNNPSISFWKDVPEQLNWKKEEYILYEEKERTINNITYAPQHFVPDLIRSKHEQFYNKYKKFTIVRNPYTKIISEYFDYYWTRLDRPVIDLSNLQEFLNNKEIMYNRDHTLPQKKYFENIKYDYILKFENLNTDFLNMSRDFNFTGSLPHYNKSRTNIPSEYYIKNLNKISIDKINNLYSEDFQFLNYSFM